MIGCDTTPAGSANFRRLSNATHCTPTAIHMTPLRGYATPPVASERRHMNNRWRAMRRIA